MAGAATLHEDDTPVKGYDRRLIRRLLSYVRPYQRLVYASLVLLLVEGVLQLAGPLLTQRVIDVAFPRRDDSLIVTCALLYAGALMLQFACEYGATAFAWLLGQRVMRDLRMQVFSHIQRLPVPFLDRNPAGRLMTRVTSDVETLNELFTAGVVSGLGDIFTLAAISIGMIIIDWRLALAAFAVIPFLAGVSWLFRASVRSSYREVRARVARINSFLQERITGMRLVQLFGQEERERQRFEELNRDHLRAHLRSITAYALYFPAVELLTSIALAMLIVTGASRVHESTLTIGTVAAFLQLVGRFFQPLQDLADKFNIVQSAMASSERIFGLLEEKEAPAAVPARAENVETRISPPSVSIRFEDVWFAYDVGHVSGRGPAKEAALDMPAARSHEREWVLRGVSFEATPGRTLALVGHTGAGKTTIVNLLMRFYEPQRGRILVNDRDIREMSPSELRALMAYVQQDIFLFAADVASNIRLSNKLTEEQVRAAAERVGVDRVIARLPGGYSHKLGERGASLSVGERQLLSFARAVAADAPLLILDEATSAVDSEVEAAIQRALAVLLEGRTTIAVAHRLSTIVRADEILVLHHGEVVERGRHHDLLAQGGLYERMWRLQAGESAAHARVAGQLAAPLGAP